YFRQTGGIIMEGDAVTGVTRNEAGLRQVWTRNHGDIALQARHVVLASGSFFSNGLVAERQRVREAIFDLDLLDYAANGDWSHPDFFHSQPWQSIGVKTNARLQPSRNGEPLDGVYAIGTVLGGFDPITQGCGGGG
ncbi:FAD-binding protein, partial [Atlantibacter subterraneus]|uniref:FAD-binding protein n=1 Tax=Atlantibacter subterraneus TaxID=255519 RepID=UPI002FDDAD2C